MSMNWKSARMKKSSSDWLESGKAVITCKRKDFSFHVGLRVLPTIGPSAEALDDMGLFTFSATFLPKIIKIGSVQIA